MVWAAEERIGSRVVVMKVFLAPGVIWVRLRSLNKINTFWKHLIRLF